MAFGPSFIPRLSSACAAAADIKADSRRPCYLDGDVTAAAVRCYV